MMRPAMHEFFGERGPVQRMKQRGVLALHMREEGRAAKRVRTAHGKLDQRRAKLAVPPERGMHGEPRAGPYTGFVLVNPYRPDDLLRHSANTTYRDEQLRALVDFIAVVADKNPLLDAEHRPPQLVRFVRFPRQRGPLDRVGGGGVEAGKK